MTLPDAARALEVGKIVTARDGQVDLALLIR